jgi:tetratricopeptide (TPR) repeat protein
VRMRVFEFQISSRWQSVAFLAASALLSCLIAGESLRAGAAAVVARSFDLAHLERSVRIQPANPALHRRLGLYYLDSAQDVAPGKAVYEFRLAIELSPLETPGWTGLAQACEAAGDEQCADHSLEHALKLSPMAPRLYWQAALNFVMTSRPREALPYFRRLLALDPDYASSVFRLCPWSLENPEFVLDHVLPKPASAMLTLSYIDYLSAHDKDDLAGIVWSRLAARHSSFPLSSAAPFLESLLRLDRERDAEAVWQDLERLGIVQQPASGAGNIIFNGSFERAPLNLGFDWRVQPSPDFFVTRDSEDAYRGNRALRVDFTMPANDDDEPVYQLVPVLPDHQYRLAAYVRSDSITSGSGPRLQVRDPFCDTCLDQATAPVTGSRSWHQLLLNFSTGAHTRLVRVSVWRPRSRSFPYEITGTFWLDNVSLIPIRP